MVPKLCMLISTPSLIPGAARPQRGGKGLGNLPECRLDTPDVEFAPIPSHDLLLTDWDSRPDDSHHSDGVPIVLVEMYLQSTIVSVGPTA